jgi:hypothetical protein
MTHRGDFDTSAVIYGKFTTFRPSTGAAYTLGGTPALSVYKDNSTTQSTSGVTLTADFDGVTGLNHFAVDTSADGAFYSAGSFFDIVITTGTVDSVSVVGAVIGSFTLRKDSSLKPTTAGRTLDVSAGGEAGLDWANIGSPTTTVGLSGTTVKTATDVETDTADIQSRLPAALVSGRIDASVGAMAANTLTASALATDALTEIQAGLSTLDAADVRTAVGLASANLDTQLTAIDDYLDTEVAAIKAKTDLIPAAPASTGDVTSARDSVLSKLLKYVQLMVRKDSAIATDNATEMTAINADGGSGAGTFVNTTEALEALRDRGDSAWITATGFSTHSAADVWAVATRVLTAGTNIALAKGTGVTGFNDLSAADVRTAVGLASANLDTQLTAIDDYLDTEVAAIKAKTDLIPAAPAAVGDIPTVSNILAGVIEGSVTLKQSIQIQNAAAASKLSGAATSTVVLRDLADSKDRITATVDADGNRSAVTVSYD